MYVCQGFKKARDCVLEKELLIYNILYRAKKTDLNYNAYINSKSVSLLAWILLFCETGKLFCVANVIMTHRVKIELWRHALLKSV